MPDSFEDYVHWIRAAQRWPESGPRFEVPRPAPNYLSMRSPLEVELIVRALFPAGIGLTTIALFRFMLKNPGAIAGFLPSIFETWDSGWAARTRARTDRLRAQDEAAEYLEEREEQRRLREISVRMTAAGHELIDAGLEVIEIEPADDEPII